MNPDDINIEYSTDGGNNWSPYYTIVGDDIQKENSKDTINRYKTSLVTTGMKQSLFLGKNENQKANDDQLRITITARDGELYMSLKKILIHFSENGATDSYVNVDYSLNGAPETYIKHNDEYKIHAWPGWASIPFINNFGGYTNFSTNVRSIRLTFYFKNYTASYETKTRFYVDNIAMFGENIWQSTNNLAKTGHIYSYDARKTAIFPDNVKVEKELRSKKITVNDFVVDEVHAEKLYPNSTASSIGDDENYWPNGYIKDLRGKYANFDEVDVLKTTIDYANIETADIKNLNLDFVSIQENYPNLNTSSIKTNLKYVISNIESHSHYEKDPYKGISIQVSNGSIITLKTSELDPVVDDTLPNISFYVCTPFAITYINDVDYTGINEWANIYLYNCILNFGIKNCNHAGTFTRKISDQTLPRYEQYNNGYRNIVVYYPVHVIDLPNTKLQKQNGKYKDIEITLNNLTAGMSRQWKGSDFDGCDLTRIGYVKLQGCYVVDKLNYSPTSKKFWFYTGSVPGIWSFCQERLGKSYTTTGNIPISHYANNPSQNKVYITKKGIQIVNGRSYLRIHSPSDNGGTGDGFGYIEVAQYNNGKYTTKHKSLYNILN